MEPDMVSGDVPAEHTGKSADDKQEEAREILTRLYSKYCPSKLSQIDTLLDHYQGQEDTLCEKVREKYEGKSQKEIDRIRQYVVQLYKEHAPHKMGNINQLMKIYRGREEKLVDDLVLKYETKTPGSTSKSTIPGFMGKGKKTTRQLVVSSTFSPKDTPSYCEHNLQSVVLNFNAMICFVGGNV
jgi:hypothetical protein